VKKSPAERPGFFAAAAKKMLKPLCRYWHRTRANIKSKAILGFAAMHRVIESPSGGAR
jgi:hypothetical protein